MPENHNHKTVSIRESDYVYLGEVSALLQLRDKRRVSLCEAMNWLTTQAKELKIKIDTGPELRIAKKDRVH